MHKVTKILLDDAKIFLKERSPDNGLAALAHESLQDKPCYALAPEGTKQSRAESLLEGGLTSWHDTLPELIEIFKIITDQYPNSFICVQMLVAGPNDFPRNEGFEISSRPYRSIVDGIVYISAPTTDISPERLYEFINYDIGFKTAIILLDRPLTEEWFSLKPNEKKDSILAISYDVYDGESFLYLA